MDNPSVALTDQFNRGRLRAILSSGQAVVLYRLAIMSKDGDWILREDEEALGHVLQVLAAPVRAMRDEFLSEEDLDLRNLTDDELASYWMLWLEQAQSTNDIDADSYSHGVFVRDPAVGAGGVRRVAHGSLPRS